MTGERCEKGRKGRMKRKDVYSHLHLPTPGIRHPFRRIDGVWLEGGGRRCRKMKIENINQEIEIIKTTYDISLDSKNFFVTKRILPPREREKASGGRGPRNKGNMNRKRALFLATERKEELSPGRRDSPKTSITWASRMSGRIYLSQPIVIGEY